MSSAAPKQVLTTREAARRLGLSVTSVQRLVLEQTLEAWITPGGHRRISSQAVERYRSARRSAPPGATDPAVAPFKVLLAHDDAVQLEALQNNLLETGWPLSIQRARDGLQALIQIERHRPQLVITELQLPPFDGFEWIQALAHQPEYAHIAVLALTRLKRDDPRRTQGLPAWVTVHEHPVVPSRLLGYLESLRSQQLREAQRPSIPRSTS